MQFRFAIASRRRVAAVGAVALGLVPFVLISCGPGEKPWAERLPVYPVKGSIFVNGKPAKGVRVDFMADPPLQHPAEARGAIAPRADTDEKGDYVITTYEQGDGAPAAKYYIRLKAPLRAGGFSRSDEGEVDRLGDEYKDAKKNAEKDPKFTFEVKKADPKGEPQVIPRIDLPVEGWEATEPEPGLKIDVPQ